MRRSGLLAFVGLAIALVVSACSFGSPPSGTAASPAVVTPAVGSAVTASLSKQASLSADSADLVALGLTTPAAFASLSVRYELQAASGFISQTGSVRLPQLAPRLSPAGKRN